MTPADWDGATAPPAGAPGYIMRHRDTEVHSPFGYPDEDFLEIWQRWGALLKNGVGPVTSVVSFQRVRRT